jgi:anti-sigma factor RsiW
MQEPVDDSLLCAYADGELDAVTAREIETLAAHNPVLRQRIALFQQSRDLMKAAWSRASCSAIPGHLRSSIEQAVYGSRRRATTHSRMRWGLAAAVLLIAFGLGATVMRLVEHGTVLPRSGVATVLHEIAEYHPVYAREVEHLVEVAASRREHIEEWLGDRVGLKLRVPDLSSHGLTFRGARLIAVHDQALAQLMYTGEKEQRVAICVTRLVGRPSPAIESLLQDGIKLHGLSKGAHVFLVVGPVDEPAVDQLATDIPSLLVRP